MQEHGLIHKQDQDKNALLNAVLEIEISNLTDIERVCSECLYIFFHPNVMTVYMHVFSLAMLFGTLSLAQILQLHMLMCLLVVCQHFIQ